ncbi:MAG TPA: ECF-type sigma factor, partial [Pirellulaceae bacterium]
RLLEHGKLDEQDSLADTIGRSAHVMTQVLIDHARRRMAQKRGGQLRRVGADQLRDVEAAMEAPDFDWELLDRSLAEMSQQDPRRHAVVMLRFFGGLNHRQIADELRVDERTVGRDWNVASRWLHNVFSQAEH